MTEVGKYYLTRVTQLGYVDELFDIHEKDGGKEHQEALAWENEQMIVTEAYKQRHNQFKDWLRQGAGEHAPEESILTQDALQLIQNSKDSRNQR